MQRRFANKARAWVCLCSAITLTLLTAAIGWCATPPGPGDTAPDFTLRTLDDKPVELSRLYAKRSVVLVVLRGWPGYQCPICTRQVGDFIAHANAFATQKAQVLMVYPGPAKDLKAHAQEFLQNQSWPRDFVFVIDPDYQFTQTYGLRWEVKNETAYPSTFVIDKTGKVRFSHVSKGHDDRVSAADAVRVVEKLE